MPYQQFTSCVAWNNEHHLADTYNDVQIIVTKLLHGVKPAILRMNMKTLNEAIRCYRRPIPVRRDDCDPIQALWWEVAVNEFTHDGIVDVLDADKNKLVEMRVF